MYNEGVMPSSHPIHCWPLFLPSVFPSIRVFSKESVPLWPMTVWDVLSVLGSLLSSCVDTPGLEARRGTPCNVPRQENVWSSRDTRKLTHKVLSLLRCKSLLLLMLRRLAGLKARGCQTEERGCKCQTFSISLLSGKRNSAIFFPFLYTNLKRVF